jgi:DNA (cytosine-5)-methyltransferase 1
MGLAFVDLFAGIGGFHAAMDGLGAHCVLASEIDPAARRIYEENWGHSLLGEMNEDIRTLSSSSALRNIPDHDILFAGFPCQPFSKSGYQKGVSEARGTLFFDIARIIESKRPRVVVLENVRNLIGPRHISTWISIRSILRSLGYVLPDEPTVFSPHLLPFERGGRPQVRERVFIVAVHRGRGSQQARPLRPISHAAVDGWKPECWNLAESILQHPEEIEDLASYTISDSEIEILQVWDDFLQSIGSSAGRRLPGFPIWSDEFKDRKSRLAGLPDWKRSFISRNHAFYREHRKAIEEWRTRNPRFVSVPLSRRKFEWQAFDRSSVWDCLIQFRPSGIRVRPPTYVPALVAMNQTSIYGPEKRRLTLREGARLQGFPESFSFGSQRTGESFRQLGNAVSVGVVKFVLQEHAKAWDFFPEDISGELLK